MSLLLLNMATLWLRPFLLLQLFLFFLCNFLSLENSTPSLGLLIVPVLQCPDKSLAHSILFQFILWLNLMESDGGLNRRFLFLRAIYSLWLVHEPAIPCFPDLIICISLSCSCRICIPLLLLFSIFLEIDPFFYLNTMDGKSVSFTKKIVEK